EPRCRLNGHTQTPREIGASNRRHYYDNVAATEGGDVKVGKLARPCRAIPSISTSLFSIPTLAPSLIAKILTNPMVAIHPIKTAINWSLRSHSATQSVLNQYADNAGDMVSNHPPAVQWDSMGLPLIKYALANLFPITSIISIPEDVTVQLLVNFQTTL
ncbi:hypothetical protein PCANC_27185, partial [Puccinia coronata f. sp. avenae]